MLDGRKRSVGRTRVGSLVVLGLASVLWVGCGDGSPPESGLVRVTGRVTLDGGSWPIPGQITFVPRGTPADPSKGAARSAVATFAKSGDFEVIGGYGEGKGLRPGEYWVAVDCPEGEPEMVDPTKKTAPPKNYAPERYRNAETSGLNVRVGDAPVEANFDVKTKQQATKRPLESGDRIRAAACSPTHGTRHTHAKRERGILRKILAGASGEYELDAPPRPPKPAELSGRAPEWSIRQVG